MGRKKGKTNAGDMKTNSEQAGVFESSATNESSSGKAMDKNMQGYFRRIFNENPSWLEVRSNDAVKEKWHADHPGEELTASWLNALTNVKSTMKNKPDKKATSKKSAPAAAAPKEAKATTIKPAVRALAKLEEQLDESLMLAKSIGGEVMEPIADQLRKTRNAIIKMSE